MSSQSSQPSSQGGGGAAFHQAALVSLKQNNVTSAITLVKKAIKAEPRNLASYELLSTIHTELNDMDQAFLNAEIIIKLSPTTGKGYLLVGKLLRMQGLLQEAYHIYYVGTIKVSREDSGYDKLWRYYTELKKHLGIPDKENTEKATKSGEKTKKTKLQRLKRTSEIEPKPKLEAPEEPKAISADVPTDTKCLLYLPLELFSEVCKQLTTRELCRLMAINNRMRRFITSYPAFWAKIDFCSPASAAPPKLLSPANVGTVLGYGKSKIKELVFGRWSKATSGIFKLLLKHKPNLVRFELVGAANIPSQVLADSLCLLGKLQLSSLNLDDSGLTEAGAKMILETCRFLTSASFRNCNFGRNAFSVISCNEPLRLETLSLARTQVGVNGVAEFSKKSPHLQHLDLGECENVDATVFRHLSGFRALTSLSLFKTAVAGSSSADLLASLEVYAGFGNLGLRSLQLANTPSIDSSCINVLSKACPFLQAVHLSVCANVTDEGVVSLAEGCPRLRHVFLAKCFRVSDVGAMAIVKGCRELEVLDISGTGVRDGFVDEVLEVEGVLERLRDLRMAGCSGVSGPGFVKLAKHSGRFGRLVTEVLVVGSFCE
ncbi:hypothetical protein HDU97_000224 [Phlyctochytrium planicorne]|nr:hypothetical protein HDU97_000224 [Phlyctochytrium planicorne]